MALWTTHEYGKASIATDWCRSTCYHQAKPQACPKPSTGIWRGCESSQLFWNSTSTIINQCSALHEPSWQTRPLSAPRFHASPTKQPPPRMVMRRKLLVQWPLLFIVAIKRWSFWWSAAGPHAPFTSSVDTMITPNVVGSISSPTPCIADAKSYPSTNQQMEKLNLLHTKFLPLRTN